MRDLWTYVLMLGSWQRGIAQAKALVRAQGRVLKGPGYASWMSSLLNTMLQFLEDPWLLPVGKPRHWWQL